jgi:hypothetical protein
VKTGWLCPNGTKRMEQSDSLIIIDRWQDRQDCNTWVLLPRKHTRVIDQRAITVGLAEAVQYRVAGGRIESCVRNERNHMDWSSWIVASIRHFSDDARRLRTVKPWREVRIAPKTSESDSGEVNASINK